MECSRVLFYLRACFFITLDTGGFQCIPVGAGGCRWITLDIGDCRWITVDNGDRRWITLETGGYDCIRPLKAEFSPSGAGAAGVRPCHPPPACFSMLPRRPEP